MNPFTNHLQQKSPMTMHIVSLFNKVGTSKWFKSSVAVSSMSPIYRFRSGSLTVVQKLPFCIRNYFEHPAHKGEHVLGTEDISSWFSELVVIIVPTIIVAPMFALYAIHSTWDRMACLWGFAIIFAFMTRHLAGKSSEIIFATNAACVSSKADFMVLMLIGPDFAPFSSFLLAMRCPHRF